jgi:uncharacterized protein YqhQ
MMRTPDAWAVAVRKPDGSIYTERHAAPDGSLRGPLRGVRTVASSLRIGARALRVAVRETMGAEPTTGQLGATFGSVGVAVLAIFIIAPGLSTSGRSIGAAVIEASIRCAMLVVYLAAISRPASTRAILRYHGAEHKVIAAFERHGRAPSREEARATSPIHMRCGTTFIALFVMACGVVFAVVPRSPAWLGAVLRAGLTPVVVALAYEVMRGAAREPRSVWARAVSWPGRALQRMTTREPDAAEIDVALAALGCLVP